jgi:hypothetical protein
MRYIIYVTLASLLLLAACGASPSGGTTDAQPTLPASSQFTPAAAPDAAEATQAPAPAQTPQPEPAEPTGQALGQAAVISLQKTGGIAGINETMMVYADGKVTVTGRGGAKEAQLATAELSPLQQLLSSPEFASVEGNYRAVGADLFTYRLTVAEGDTQRTIVTMDGAQHPAVLDQVLAELAKLEAQVK